MDLHELKQMVARVFTELGAAADSRITETRFLNGGRYVAVAFRAGSLSAVWCPDDAIIEFRFDAQVLRTVRLPDEEVRRAA